ncbi:hypothetical protein N9Z47_02755 [bacterium]|nr:hypothetical protein [bacterium]
MIQELVFTSAPKGLKLGSSGFCTVASTPGMAPNLAKQLQGLSAYRHLNPPGSTGAKSNPVVYSHVKIKIGGKWFSILSRIADAGLDYSNRSNKLAHHFAVENTAALKEGPSSLLKNESQFFVNWNQDPTKLEPRSLVGSNSSARACHTWKTVTGDGGWAGNVIEAVQKKRTVYLVVSPTTPVLELIDEVLALLPFKQQWDLTFSTFYTKTSGNIECNVRCVMDGSPEVALARRSQSNVVIDLTSNQGMSKSEFAGNARHGIIIEEKKSTFTPIGTELSKIEPGLANFFQPDLNEQTNPETPGLDYKPEANPPVLTPGLAGYRTDQESSPPTLTTNYKPEETPSSTEITQSKSKYPLVVFCAVLLVLILGLVFAYPRFSNLANVMPSNIPEPEKPEPEKPEPEKPEPEKPEPRILVNTFEDIEKLQNKKVSNLKQIKERLISYKKNPNKNNRTKLQQQFHKAVNKINSKALFGKIDTVNHKLENEIKKLDLDKIQTPGDTEYGYKTSVEKLKKLIEIGNQIRIAKEKFDTEENKKNFKNYRATLERFSNQSPRKKWSDKTLETNIEELENRLVKLEDIINSDQTNFGTENHKSGGPVFKIKNYKKEKLNFIDYVKSIDSFDLKTPQDDGVYRYKESLGLGIANKEYDKITVAFKDLDGNSKTLYPAAITVDYISVRVDKSNNISGGGIKIEDLKKYEVDDFSFEKPLELYRKNPDSKINFSKPMAKIAIQKNTDDTYKVVWKNASTGEVVDFKEQIEDFERKMNQRLDRQHAENFKQKHLSQKVRQALGNKDLLKHLKEVENRLNQLYQKKNGLGFNGGNPVDQNAINDVVRQIKDLLTFPTPDDYRKRLNAYRKKEIPWEKNWKNGNLNFSVRAKKKNGRGYVWIVCYFEDKPRDLEDVTKEPLNATETTPNQNQNGSILGLGISPCGI